jgi:hypothetical protein
LILKVQHWGRKVIALPKVVYKYTAPHPNPLPRERELTPFSLAGRRAGDKGLKLVLNQTFFAASDITQLDYRGVGHV